MIWGKCTLCEKISKNFKSKRPCTHPEYIEAFMLMRNLVKSGDIVFEAGCCPLDELEDHLEKEDLYTIEHYFRCKCGKLYYTGCCMRGRPIMEIVDSLPENIDSTISGKYGSYFEKRKNIFSLIRALDKE